MDKLPSTRMTEEELSADLERIANSPQDPNDGRPEGYEMFEGQPRKVVNSNLTGWWRFHKHYDRNGYCDNPARGY